MPTRGWKLRIAAGLLLSAASGSTALAQGGREASTDLEVMPSRVPAGTSQPPGMILPNGHAEQGWSNDNCSDCGLSKWQRMKRNLQRSFLGDPREWQAPPVGYWLYMNNRVQVSNGDAARMVLYHFDFCEGSDQLNLAGKDKLARIAGLLPKNAFPIVIERTPDNVQLAEKRRVAVFNELAHWPFPIPAERVIVAVPYAKGLNSIEAPVIANTLYTNTQSQGTAYSQGTGGADGGTAGGFGPSGGFSPGGGTTGGTQ
jgi:hypothetical protein